MGAVVEHGGNSAVHIAKGGVLYDDDCHTGRGEILLRTGINDVIFAYIDRTGEDVARHIGHQRYIYIRIEAHFGTEYGIVAGEVEIVGILGNSEVLGDISIVLVF